MTLTKNVDTPMHDASPRPPPPLTAQDTREKHSRIINYTIARGLIISESLSRDTARHSRLKSP